MGGGYIKQCRDYFADILRILAILMVLSVHIRGYLAGVPDLINSVMGLGAYGVALYFLISGYFSYSSVRRHEHYGAYVKSRLLRILPMYYISLVLTFVFDVLIYKTASLDWKWIFHIFFLNMFIPSTEWAWWNSVNFFWTMPCFMAWYLLSPLIFKVCKNTERMAIATLMSACITPFLKKWMLTFACEQFVNWNFFSLMYDFLFGALAWYAIKENKKGRGLLYGAVITAVGLLLGNRSGFFVFGAFFYVVILGLNFIKIDWKHDTVNKIIVMLSSVTYSVYLFHYFILQICGECFGMIPWIVSYVFFVVCSFALGYLLWRFIEKPVGRDLKKLT